MRQTQEKKQTKILSALGILFVTAFSANTYAYFGTVTTGDMLVPGQYSGGLETQFVTNEDSGANLVGHFEGALNEDFNYLAELGFGTTDFHSSARLKWVPFPDVDRQPAIGLIGGLGYSQYDDSSELSFRIQPIVSKKFVTDIGDLIPYVSLPVGVRSYDDETFSPVQLVFGAELKTLYFKNLTFFGEVGFELSDAFTYISFAGVYRFGDGIGGVSSGGSSKPRPSQGQPEDVSGFNN